jgi:hypothetical protein
MGILNSKTGCFSSGDFASACPTFPNARSISASKFPVPLFSPFFAGGFGACWAFDTLFITAFDEPVSEVSAFFTPPSEFMRYEDEFDVREGDARVLDDRSRAGGRDFISFARAKEIVGAV